MWQWLSAGRVGESSLKVLPCMIDSTYGESEHLAREVMLARSTPTCSTFGLSSSSEPLRACPVDLPRVYSSLLFSRNLNACSYVRFTKHTYDSYETQRRSVTHRALGQYHTKFRRCSNWLPPTRRR